jgi:uncharacterized BrkB/YihY/UPF0761 family membrane protein
MSRTATLPTQIALGWLSSLLIQTIAFLLMVVASLLREVPTNFRSLHYDPGTQGLKLLPFLAAYYGLMPLFVFVVDRLRSRALRWVEVAAASLGALFLLLHHLSHMYFGQRPDFSSNVLDLTLHGISIWIIVTSIRWARIPARAAAPVLTNAPAAAS